MSKGAGANDLHFCWPLAAAVGRGLVERTASIAVATYVDCFSR